jgi:hypothetical protein
MSEEIFKFSDAPPTQPLDSPVNHPDITEIKRMLEKLGEKICETNDKLDRIINNPRIVR